MFRPLFKGTGLPMGYTVDPNATFQPGMIGQLKRIGNEVVMGVSDGIAPFGIIDDIKDTAMIRPVIDEIIIVRPDAITSDGYNFYSASQTIEMLQNPSIIDYSWSVDIAGLSLISNNGVIVVPAGTLLNYTELGHLTPNAIKVRARYSYYVPNLPGDDTTLGSGRVTIWYTRGVYETDMYETAVPYVVNSTLFVSANGKLTSEQSLPNQPGMALCMVPPTTINPFLQFLWM